MAEHVIAEIGNIETTRAWDIDGDGVLEIVPNTPCTREVRVFKLKRGADGKGQGAFDEHVIHRFPEGKTQGHGLGCGDIAGNGRMDIVLARGLARSAAGPVERRVDLAPGVRASAVGQRARSWSRT